MKIPSDMSDWVIRENGVWAHKEDCTSRGYKYHSWHLYYQRTCKRCGVLFLANKGSADKNRAYGVYCSRKCAAGSGKEHAAWKGGVQKCGGYVYVWNPSHPNANSRGYVAEHVLVSCENIGRPLVDREQVHHINGIKTDNRPDNLIVMTINEHRSLHERLKKQKRQRPRPNLGRE